VDLDAVVATLGKTDGVGKLPEEDLRGIAAIVREELLPARAVVYRQGDPSDACYVVVQGSVEIQIGPEGQEETTLAVIGRGQSFGEMALLDGGPRAASVVTLEPTNLLAIPRDGWLALIEADPTLSARVLDILGGAVRRYAHHGVECLFLDQEGRVADILLQLAERSDRIAPGARLDLVPTQAEIARMVRGTRQRVNTILGSLELVGYLRRDDAGITILDPEGLRDLATP
jgi:CRP-like cAMP-binding protein